MNRKHLNDLEARLSKTNYCFTVEKGKYNLIKVEDRNREYVGRMLTYTQVKKFIETL